MRILKSQDVDVDALRCCEMIILYYEVEETESSGNKNDLYINLVVVSFYVKSFRHSSK